MSVVLQNNIFGQDLTFWRGVGAYAYVQGFVELADYARYRQLDLAYLEAINGFPAGQTLTDPQQEIVRAYESNRLLATAAMLADRGTIASQMDRLEADQANVLANGYYQEMRTLLSSYGIPNRLVSPDFSPDSISGSMLVIPTAGLYGMDADTVFADRLERFVDQGGTLLVMSQPGNETIDMLPGDWQQVDYHNDVSCYADAMTIIQYHPILASVADPHLTAHVDGYMTAVPSSSQLLMERTKNQEGAFVLHEYGQGRMIVTNMYDDWGRTVGQSSIEVRNLFRDVVRWASIGGKTLPEERPSDLVTVNVEVANVIYEDTVKIQWLVRKPNGIEVDSGLALQDLSLSPGQSVPQTVNFTPGDTTLGFWTLNYRLLDAGDQVLQGETLGGYFIVSDPPAPGPARDNSSFMAPFTPGATDTDVTLMLDKEAYAPGDSISATLDITLSDPGSVSDLKVIVSLGETTLEQIVTAQANQQVDFGLPADFSGNGLMFYGVYEAATGQGLYLNTQWVQKKGNTVTIVPAAPNYAPGDTVTLKLTGAYAGRLFVNGRDIARTIEVSGQLTVTFDLPTILSSGPIKVHYEDSGFRRTARFDVIGPQVIVSEMKTDQPIIAPGAEAELIATIVTDQVMDVRVTGHIVDGDGFIFPAISLTETLKAGEQTLTMTLPISTTTSGSVRFEMTIADGKATAVTYVQAHRYLTIDAPVLQAMRAANGELTTADNQEVSLDWHAPSTRTVEVTLWLEGVQVASESVNLSSSFSTTKMSLPDGLSPGSYALYASADLGDGLTTSASVIVTVVESSSQSVYLPIIIR